MERHKKQSFWSSYVSSLPPKPPWIPSLLSVEYIELLPADLRLAAKKSRRLLEESWSRIKKSIKRDWTCSCCGKRADCVLDVNTFTWGYILVNTRAVYVNPEIVRESCGSCEDILSDQPCMALCPYLDMFNHSHTARTRAELIRREGRLVYQLTALNSTKKHQQVFISYGAHDNVKLLTEYGFFIPGNRFDSIQIRSEDVLKVLNLNLNDSQYKFIRTHGLDKSDLYIGEGGPSFNLKAFLFVAFKDSTAKNFASIIYSDSYPKHFLEGIVDSCRKLLYLHLELTEKALRTFQDLASIDSERDVSVIIDFLKYRREFVKVLCDNKQ
ncbi:SET domain containing protein [Asbolus verrucosus]|uniref:SET domain containing protein n=1 Tax=Asbolus verrucosus TaxID=1661398 RepID=A0A482W073_ASBVE|nr:SET domain containing protein [Asbolus verrucosus]